MSKQSSVEWLYQKLFHCEINIFEWQHYLEQAKAMHKDEIEEAELRGKEIIIIKNTENLTPIELPSDAEIKKESEWLDNPLERLNYQEGMKWMRDKIQGGNK